jgi:outer membrane protein
MRTIVIICSFILEVGICNAQQDSTWTLQKCIGYAFNRNIQIRKSEISNQRSGLYAEQAIAQRMPSINGSFNENFTWSKDPLTGQSAMTGANGSNFSINSGITLYNASKINNQIKQAGLEVEAGKYSLETTKESISLSILNAYLQVLYAEEQVKNSQKQIESTSGQLNLAQERLTLKSISISDYAQVKSQLASEKENFVIVHPDLEEVLNQRRLPDVVSVYETALTIKPQVKNAELNKQIASLDEKIAKSSYFPVLSANAGISAGYSSTATDPYFSQLNSGLRPTAGFSLSIPIYQKKQIKTSVAVAKLGYQDAELSETDTKNQLRKNIEQVCLDVRSARIEYEASIEKYQATSESSALSDEKFRQGIINSVDYLVTKTNMIVAESQLLQSKYKLIFSYKILDFYMGIPLSL